jgi:benzodiazapine receptor
MRWKSLVLWIVGSHAAGALGALATDSSFYRELPLPGWAPPGWVFGPVWLALYTMMGLAAWRVWTRPPSAERARALAAYAIQLALNAAWTPVFFGLRSPIGGLIVIVVLWFAIVSTIRRFHHASRGAALLLVPYLVWVTFATALNAAIVLAGWR